MEKHLFENEEILITSNKNTVTLTNRRIRKTTSSWGKACTISMHLENLSTIEIRYRSWPMLLVLALCFAGT